MCTSSCQKYGLSNSACHGWTSTTLPSLEAEARRVVHPAVDRDHHQRAGEAGDHDRDAAQEVRARREPVPAVDVDPDEDRLEEEREALDREAEPEHAAERRGEVRPQQAHLEAEDRAGDRRRRRTARASPSSSAARALGRARRRCAGSATRRTAPSPGTRSRSRPAGCAPMNDSACIWRASSRYSCWTGASAAAEMAPRAIMRAPDTMAGAGGLIAQRGVRRSSTWPDRGRVRSRRTRALGREITRAPSTATL